MSACRGCGQPSIVADANGPLCPDCADAYGYDDAPMAAALPPKAHVHYTVGQLCDDSFAIYYQSAPKVDTKGKVKSLSMRFPALIASEWLDDPESDLQRIADALNASMEAQS